MDSSWTVETKGAADELASVAWSARILSVIKVCSYDWVPQRSWCKGSIISSRSFTI